MPHFFKRSLKVTKGVELWYSWAHNKLFFKGVLGNFSFPLASYLFYNCAEDKCLFIFLSRLYFMNFITCIRLVNSKYNRLFFLKLRIKGLGFYFRDLAERIFVFFFNYINHFYLYRPRNLYIKQYKKRMVLVSNDWSLLQQIAVYILSLKRKGPYDYAGIRRARFFVILKERAKLI